MYVCMCASVIQLYLMVGFNWKKRRVRCKSEEDYVESNMYKTMYLLTVDICMYIRDMYVCFRNSIVFDGGL